MMEEVEGIMEGMMEEVEGRVEEVEGMVEEVVEEVVKEVEGRVEEVEGRVEEVERDFEVQWVTRLPATPRPQHTHVNPQVYLILHHHPPPLSVHLITLMSTSFSIITLMLPYSPSSPSTIIVHLITLMSTSFSIITLTFSSFSTITLHHHLSIIICPSNSFFIPSTFI
ncbi:hypothetical protein Pcinc_028024 [Petrolisthes cinctipes]|uniref:Uncharacterized protein n=1 Tax=Petrolisthes cinctipes TaxID=88211 RepID=A0AAE1F3X3_PETCI|nr:hypothetical protein Pcinc_028024 [Petrolisthes cinctipes]